MRAGARWALALGLSGVTHLGLAAALALTLRPEPVERQAMPESRLDLAAYAVENTEVPAEAAAGEAAEAARTGGAAVAQAAVPVSAAAALPAPAAALGASPPPAAVLDAAAPPPAVVAETAAAVPLPAFAAPAAVAVEAAPPEAIEPLPAQPDTLPVIALPAAVSAPALSAASIDLAATAPEAAPAAPLAGPAHSALLPPPATPATQTAAARLAAAAPSSPATGERAAAALAWSGGAGDQVDPVSLAAIQAFMQPGDVAAASGQVRDGLEAVLAAVPCARMQAAFIPETGQLELRGHIPEEGLRAPVLAALQAQVGSAIPVTDNLLILPRPQCGALAGIGAVGLPQSTDQLTNPRLVGADAHARAYSYRAGQRLTFDLTAPDYDAHIYVDFFDAGGNVIHLVPNETIPLTLHAAQSLLTVGGDYGGPSLNITIGPPFGQEITVAFAASAPLYEGLRPFVEPADAYLEWLKARVAEARAADPGFKGEWVYFFITTAP